MDETVTPLDSLAEATQDKTWQTRTAAQQAFCKAAFDWWEAMASEERHLVRGVSLTFEDEGAEVLTFTLLKREAA